MNSKKERQQGNDKVQKQNTNTGYPQQDIDKLSQEAEQARTKKPGSQSNSSKQHNNGRGGGK